MPKPKSPSSRFIAEHFGARLKELRGEGRPQAVVAKRAGVSAEQVSQLERGDSQPTLSTMLALQEALGLETLEELIGPAPAPAPSPSTTLWRAASIIENGG